MRTRAVAFIQIVILVVFLIVSLGGCSELSGNRSSAPQLLPPKQSTTVSKPVIKREPGSLWSEDSNWNSIYSNPPSRGPGDVLVVKLTPQFKGLILGKLDRDYPTEAKPKNNTEPSKAETKEKEPKGTVSEKTGINDDDSKVFHATVIEALPRGLYRVATADTIRLESRDPVITLEGEIREKDIQDDDSISADSILNVVLSVKLSDGQRRPAAD